MNPADRERQARAEWEDAERLTPESPSGIPGWVGIAPVLAIIIAALIVWIVQ